MTKLELAKKMMAKINDSKKSTKAMYFKKSIANEGLFLKKDDMEIDIVPYKVTIPDHPYVKKGEVWYCKSYYMHRGIGINGESVICPTTYNEPCPICQYRKKAYNSKNPDKDYLSKINRKKREVYNVLADGKVLLFDISTFCFGELLYKTIDISRMEEYLKKGIDNPKDWDRKTKIAYENFNFYALKKGKTLLVTSNEQTIGAKDSYTKAVIINFDERDDIDESILDSTVDLDNAFEMKTYDELNEMFNSGISFDTPDEIEIDDEEYDKTHFPKVTHEEVIEVDEEIEVEEDEVEEEISTEKKETKTDEEYTCPHGFVFAADFEKYSECEDCNLFMQCYKANK